jgi:hypothetical protein
LSPSSSPSTFPATQIFFEGFEGDFGEGDFGNFLDGGDDAQLNFNNVYEGAASLRIRDNSGSSFAQTLEFDVSAFSELEVDFFYLSKDFEMGENFFVEFDDGNGWEIAHDFRFGREFNENDVWVAGQVTFDFERGSWKVDEVQFPSAVSRSNFRFRFRCDAEQNRDRIFIDNVNFEGKGYQIFFEDFDNGYGNFVDGGNDAEINMDVVFDGPGGSLRIRDNSPTSVATTITDYDLSAFSEVQIDFYYLSQSFETNKRFVLDFDDGNGWEEAQDFVRGRDFFENNVWTPGSVIFNFENGSWNVGGVQFPDADSKESFKFRFRCDAGNNSDMIFIDNVSFQAK